MPACICMGPCLDAVATQLTWLQQLLLHPSVMRRICLSLRLRSPASEANSNADFDRKTAADLDEPESSTPQAPHIQHAIIDGKTTLDFLKSVAALMPIPFLRGTIDVAIKVLETCQDVIEIETSTRGLDDRVAKIMYAVMTNVAVKSDVKDIAPDMENYITDLGRTLEEIRQELEKIKGRNKWLIAIERGSIKTRVDQCTHRLDDAVQIFQVINHLSTVDMLQNLQNRLSSQHHHLEDIGNQVGSIAHKLLREPISIHMGSNGVLEPIPHKPIVFHGREEAEKSLTRILCDEARPRVCILGAGGMGKTTLAAAVIQSQDVQDKFKLRFWVPCIQATSTALFLELLYRYLQISRSSGNLLNDVIYELNASNDPRLLLLDNFETLWHNSEPTRRQLRNILPELAKIPHVALLVTMRGNRGPCHEYVVWTNHKLGPLDLNASRQIYHDLNQGSCDDPDVDRLLAIVGHLPFAVTLLANRGAQSESPAGFLLEEWTQLGTNMVSDEDGNLNRCISLSVDSNYVQKNPDALTLLGTISLLPAGTPVRHLRWWAPELTQISSARAILTGAGLLDDKMSQVLSTLPVVQAFMASTGRISDTVRKQVLDGCCDYVMHQTCREHDLYFRERSEALASEDANIQSILLASHPAVSGSSNDKFIRALLAFAFYRLDTRPNLEIAQHCLKVIQSSNNEQYMGEASLALGRTYWRLGNFTEAERHLSIAYRLLQSVKAMNKRIQMHIVECSWALIQTLRNLEYPSTDLLDFGCQFRDRIGDVRDPYLQGNIFRVIGFCYMCPPQNLDPAVDNLLQSAMAFRQVKNLDCRADVADVMQLMAKLHHSSFRLPEALKAIEEAANAITNSDSHKRLRGVVLRIHGEILITLGEYQDALLKLEESLLLSRRVGHLFGTAWTLEHFGYIYASRGNYEDAIMTYETAVNMFTQMNTDTSPLAKQGVNRCRENLMEIEKTRRLKKADISLSRFISVD